MSKPMSRPAPAGRAAPVAMPAPVPARLPGPTGSIRAVVTGPRGVRVVTAGYPGLRPGTSGREMEFDPGACLATLGAMRRLGVQSLVTLVDPVEIPAAGQSLLERCAARTGLNLVRAPIPDMAVPDAAFVAWWRGGARKRAALWARGGALGICCRHGAGRSGTVASLCLIEAGMTAEAAIARVRAGFADSVETEGQAAWLAAQAGRRVARA